ncbi:MAG: protein kinase [Kofleriaceae bacterium]|nr:protein kinase [Kofleriaceae bacterium]
MKTSMGIGMELQPQCPDDETIAGYIQDRLSETSRAWVNSHLDACEECRTLVSALAKTEGPQEPPSEHWCGLEPGSFIDDKYEIVEEIGEGGMGVVYLAKQAGLQRTVAIKLMRSEIHASVDAAVRFAREARITAQIDSPHVVNILDVGVTSDKIPYMVMEHLKGCDLATYIADHAPLQIAEVVSIVQQLCVGLREAHAVGVVHRDLKPANVFLVRSSLDQSITRVVILDFGVSKFSESAAGGMDLTQTGMIMGSPRYMAPEQLADSKSVDYRADLWSVGIILYELLTGLPPFRSNTLVHLVTEILSGKREPISSLRPEVPAFLIAAVDQCLKIEVEQRTESASALLHALAHTQAAQVEAIPVLPPPQGFSLRAMMALLLLAVASVAAFLLWPSSDAEVVRKQPPSTVPLVTPLTVDASVPVPDAPSAAVLQQDAAPVPAPAQNSVVTPPKTPRTRPRGPRRTTEDNDDGELLDIPL